MENTWTWVFSEAGAGWIVGIIGIVTTAIGAIYFWTHRERPPKIVIQELETLRLLDIHPTQQANVHVYFGKRGQEIPINCLQQKELVIYNAGTKDITEEIEIVLWLAIGQLNSGGALRQLVVDALPAPLLVSFSDDYIPHFRVTLPYLNSMSSHNEYHKAHLISDGEIVIQRVEGRGKGWSSRLVNEDAVNRAWGKAAAVVMLVIFVTLASLLILRAESLPPEPVASTLSSWQLLALFLSIVLFLVLVIAAILFIEWLTYLWAGGRSPSTFKSKTRR